MNWEQDIGGKAEGQKEIIKAAICRHMILYRY